MEEYNGPYINQSKIFYNAIVWTAKPPPLKLSISPIYPSILLGDSVTFSSNVSGGYAPYNYQWFLNGVPVSGATTQKWVFTPTSSGTFTVYLRVIDSQGVTIKSRTSRIKVYIVSSSKGLHGIYPLQNKENFIAFYPRRRRGRKINRILLTLLLTFLVAPHN